MNHYELQLQVTCGNDVMEVPLSVDVQRDPGHIQCVGRFASPGEARGGRQGVGRHGLNRASRPLLWPAGEIIQVPETVTPGALLYTLLLPGLELQKAQVRPAHGQWGAEWWWWGRAWGDQALPG